MKILVTGGAGFIGSHVVDLYIENGFDVVVVDDLSSGRLSNLNPAAVFYKMDIRSPQMAGIFLKEKPDFVNHHAAQIDVRRSIVDPMFDSDVNITGSLNLLECARETRVKRFIFISSGGAVYGEPEYLPCDEAHPVNPICQYGVSKYCVEQYLSMYHRLHGLDYTVLRYSNVYGPRQDPYGEAGVVAIFAMQMLHGEQVTIYGDGNQERDFLYVSDCARANLAALDSEKGSHMYNLGSGQGTSVNQIFDFLKSLTNYSKRCVHGAAKPGETRQIYLDAGKAKAQLGWVPLVSLAEGLNKTVADFKMVKSRKRLGSQFTN